MLRGAVLSFLLLPAWASLRGAGPKSNERGPWVVKQQMVANEGLSTQCECLFMFFLKPLQSGSCFGVFNGQSVEKITREAFCGRSG